MTTAARVDHGQTRDISDTGMARLSMINAAGGWRGILIALGIFAGTRVAQLALVGWLGESVHAELLSWDAGWFMKVATEGYPSSYTYDPTGAMVGNGLAFFPLFPALIRLVMIFGLSVDTAAIVVGWLAGAAAAVLVYLLGTSLYDRRVGYALMVLCCTQPMSIVFSLAYSEGIFLALVAGMLLAAHRHAWLLAGGLGLAASLTRSTGAAAAVALAVAAAATARGRERRVAAGAAAVALAGVPAYLAWVGWRVGDWDAWFRIQEAGWGTRFDAGSSAAEFVWDTLRRGEGFVPISVAWLLIAAVVATGVAVAQRVWTPLTVYGLLMLILVVGQAGYYHSKPRLLVPALLILVPAARAGPRVVALVAFGAFGLWYGAYMVAVWPYTI